MSEVYSNEVATRAFEREVGTTPVYDEESGGESDSTINSVSQDFLSDLSDIILNLSNVLIFLKHCN